MKRKTFLKSMALLPFVTTAMTLKDLDRISSTFEETPLMPVLFLGHGSPMNAIEENDFTKGWKDAGKTITKPNAIICISAHWETNGTYITAMEKPKTIHDFGGFPQALFDVQYPAPGKPDLATETKSIITKSTIGLDQDWGLDHGTWSVIKHLYPNADVPVLQLSIDQKQTPQYHYDLSKQLISLRKKGVLIIGSGNMVHNLGKIAWDKMDEPEYGYDWAIEANTKMKEFILANNHAALIDFKTQGTAFDLSIPSTEHFIPLLYTLALKEEKDKVAIFNDKAIGGSITMTSVKIG